jgi:hypothetical protein
MSEQTEACHQNAQHCERAGSLAVTLEARLMYADLAHQWRELAALTDFLEQKKAHYRWRLIHGA